jgi:hypothetical protein
MGGTRSILLPGRAFGDFKSLSSHSYKKCTVIALEDSRCIEIPVDMAIKYIDVFIQTGNEPLRKLPKHY